MLRPLIIAAAALATLPVVALGQGGAFQLDDDPEQERVTLQSNTELYGYRVERPILRDACRALPIGSYHDRWALLEPRELDGDTDRPEILLEGRSGAAGRAGVTKVVRHMASAGTCPFPQHLFTYSSRRPSPAPPRGYYVAGYGVTVRKDRSLRLFEALSRNSEPAIAARRQRVSIWRYSAPADRFTRRSSRVGAIR